MILKLRTDEEIMLYANILQIAEQEATDITDFLRREYREEALNYPHTPPVFDPQAALWAAKTVYMTAQLLLYRENKSSDLVSLLPSFTGEITPSAILSADLCLRFLPDMLTELKVIDPEDALIPLIQELLTRWHYSSVRHRQQAENPDMTPIISNPCLHQLYCDRVIGFKNTALAKHPEIQPLVVASLGIHADVFWQNNELATDLHE